MAFIVMSAGMFSCMSNILKQPTSYDWCFNMCTALVSEQGAVFIDQIW